MELWQTFGKCVLLSHKGLELCFEENALRAEAEAKRLQETQ